MTEATSGHNADAGRRWLNARPGWQRLLLAFLMGMLATTALAPLFIVPALLVAFPVLILLICACTSPRMAFATGWAFGLGHFLTGFYWVSFALEIAGAPPIVWVALPLGMALYPGVAALCYWLFSRRMTMGAIQPVLFAVIWATAEWLRGHLLTGFPWNLAGYAWGFSDAMSQFAAVGGIYGLTFLTVLAACLPVLVIGKPAKALWHPLAAAAIIPAGLLMFGLIRLPAPTPPPPDAPVVRVVQANIPQEDKWRPELLARHFIDHLTLSGTAGAEEVDLFLWPEAAVPYRLDQDPARTVMIGRIARPGAFVLTGFPRAARDRDGRFSFYNSMIAVDHTGAGRALFDKFHLVPFGEYVPLRGLFSALGVERVVEAAGDFSPGPGPRTITLDTLPPVGPLVCYEVIFPGAVVGDGARPAWLFNLTNDAWYGDGSGPFQHLVIARFRSIEEGLPMVRAASTGISAIIDSYGRVEQELGLNKRGVLTGTLPPPLPGLTPYARFGDWIFLVMLILALGTVWFGARRQKRVRASTEQEA